MSMLPRVLEPEVMDTPDEARDYDSMDHAEVNRRFVDDLLICLESSRLARASRPGGGAKQSLRFLDLGAGTAQIPIELCRRTDHISIVAVDAARHMLDLATRNIAAAGLAIRIKTCLADAKSLPFQNGEFDGVISNSIVHHLPEPIAGLGEAVRITIPGGLLFFRDLLRPASEAELATLVDRYAPAAGISPGTDHQRDMFAESLHAALTLDEIRNLVAELGFSPSGVEQTSDRHWTWMGIAPARSQRNPPN
jgi:ubiquinone/menaquinone biosynthesis C-methylase UbiE